MTNANSAPGNRRTETCLCDSCNETRPCVLRRDPFLEVTEDCQEDFWLCDACYEDLAAQAREEMGR
ncbi:MAG: hypothetical protein BGO98_29625 [Myxococcales bacterium 68-20]|nr:MAG: hypothetical protein BGO98_29625 [Myxococcales bacterium 68-20]